MCHNKRGSRWEGKAALITAERVERLNGRTEGAGVRYREAQDAFSPRTNERLEQLEQFQPSDTSNTSTLKSTE